jgi:hypothetical protein
MRKLLLIGALLAVTIALGCGLPDPNKTWQINYRVTGSAQRASITMETPQGTEQHEVSIPWTSPTYTFKGMNHAYVSAQNQGESGTVSVVLVVNGSTYKQATSSGAYSIATVNWLVGSKD